MISKNFMKIGEFDDSIPLPVVKVPSQTFKTF